jgi:DNA-directed RNA polymerase subunit N (RpoN/RPB10)
MYLLCPTCGELLGNKQLVYEQSLKNICEEMGIDNDMISQGLSEKEGEFKSKRCELVNKLCRKQCCKIQMITFVDIVSLIKG